MNYGLKSKNIEISVGDKVLFRYELGHELGAKYTGC